MQWKPGSIFIWVREGEKGESERRSRSWERENQQAAAREEMEMGWVGRRKCPCFLPAPAIRHPFLEGKSVFLPLVLAPNVLNLEKKEQNPDKCILFSNYKCRIRFRPRTDVAASSRLLGVSVPAWALCHRRWQCPGCRWSQGNTLLARHSRSPGGLSRFSAISHRMSICSSKLCWHFPLTTHLFGKIIAKPLILPV